MTTMTEKSEKKEYAVQITEYASKTFNVKAEDMEHAVDVLREAYRKELVDLVNDVVVTVTYSIIDEDGFSLYTEED